jgi:hypothetical protein
MRDRTQEGGREESDLVRAIIPQTLQNFQRSLFIHVLSEMRSLHVVEVDPFTW